jgi:hypothetical protein
LSFGLGQHDRVLRAIIQRPNGQTDIIPSPPLNERTLIR